MVKEYQCFGDKRPRRIVNVLGTEYVIYERREEEDAKLKENDGYCDSSTKEIVVCVYETDVMNKGNMQAYKNQVLRHEIIHAFLAESGLDGNGHSPRNWEFNEEMVDWFAIQFPKIMKVYQELGVV